MALASNGADNGRGPFEVYAYNISSHYAEFEEMSTVHHTTNKHLHHHNEHSREHHHHGGIHGGGGHENSTHHTFDSNNNYNYNNNNYDSTSTLSTTPMYDHEWHREQYKLARAKIGEISKWHHFLSVLLMYCMLIV